MAGGHDQGQDWACVDGNEAAASVAYRLSEVAAIYPITPASPMGELADAWAASGRPNLWGDVPEVVEMQSEAGAAGVVHGAALKGALATTFTASQGLLLMLPNMFKLAGELTPAVFHVAARTVATHALSIFGDHSDVMAVRSSGFALLCSSSVQEAGDLALVAHAASLASRVPFIHFFDGFRTSHEIAKVHPLADGDLRALIDERWVAAHRARGLSPDRPTLRGSAQNPDVFFQAREAANPYYQAVPQLVQERMDRLAERVGRAYHLVDYHGAPDAERVLVVMGSGALAAAEAVDALTRAGERVGLVTVRLFQPFPVSAFLGALPATVRRIAVLDRTKEPGAVGEPLYQQVVTALAERTAGEDGSGPPSIMTRPPRVIGGRYGLASKEFTPAMAKAVLDELARERPRNHFTVGITDDVTHTSLEVEPAFVPRAAVDAEGPPGPGGGLQAVFYGLGSDGTVGSVKAAAKIIGAGTDLHVQGYFVYDSKKSGSITASHLRVAANPIRSSYLIGAGQAGFVACHHLRLLDPQRTDALERAAPGATLLLNSPWPAAATWQHLPAAAQAAILAKRLDLWVVPADRIAREVGLPGRINTVMQPCFFALAGVLPRERAIAAINDWVEHTYRRRGDVVVERNLAAVDQALGALQRVDIAAGAEVEGVAATALRASPRPPFPQLAAARVNGDGAGQGMSDGISDFEHRVTARLLAGQGDLLPVSAMPVDGAFPTGTARLEKRTLAAEIPLWDPSLCIDCGKCAIVCPHAAIRMKVFEPAALDGAPDGFQSKEFHARELVGMRLAIQVAPDDCTGCGVCVDVCPARSKQQVKHKAIDMTPIAPHLDRERANFDFFLGIPELPRTALAADSVKGSQVRAPLFEFSGACAGCGETPYLKLLSQLFGDRLLVANATGCSSIYGGNLPTTPWSVGADGRGPAWANSLFEDNAEFGLGLRVAADQLEASARRLLERLVPAVGEELARAILDANQRQHPHGGPHGDPASDMTSDAAIAAQRDRVALLRDRLAALIAAGGPEAAAAAELAERAGDLVRRSVWLVGGDGWAYDIGAGGLDHVLASGRDVNVLVLDTEVYSNTGGQASKATPRGAVAKFAARGKPTGKKDLGMEAMAYGNVFVAQVALGASDMQTVKALLEAEAWPGPSLVIAYSTCIAHGIDMAASMGHQKDAVRAGHWPLYRYRPVPPGGEHPFQLDAKPPTLPLERFMEQEGRFAVLARSDPARFARLAAEAAADARERWRYYQQLAGLDRTAPQLPDADSGEDEEPERPQEP
jgi:pyruvate-ferredoxin/flavodoxin oxidoreductase